MRSHRVFVDTSAWYAVQVADDEWHRDAVETLRGIVAGPHVLVTSNHVVGETYTLLRVTCGHAAAVRFLDHLDDTRRLERIFVQPDHEARCVSADPNLAMNLQLTWRMNSRQREAPSRPAATPPAPHPPLPVGG